MKHRKPGHEDFGPATQPPWKTSTKTGADPVCVSERGTGDGRAPGMINKTTPPIAPAVRQGVTKCLGKLLT